MLNLESMRTDKNQAQKASTEAAYLALLRYALWGGTFPALPEDLSAILQLASRQATRGLIYDALLREGPAIPRKEAARIQQILLQTYATHQMLEAGIQRIFPALQQAGIPAVLIKGQGVARNYPDPKLRECGDIDIYVGPEHLENSLRTLTPLADRVDDHIFGKHWQLWVGGCEAELHLYSLEPEWRRDRRFYRQLEAEGFSHGLIPLDFNGVRVDTPEPTFNAFYLFYHLWHHFIVGGVGLRQICDWTLHLHARQADIDRERLREMVEGMRLLGPWQLLGGIAVHDLGLPEAEFPLYDGSAMARSRLLLDIILAEGNFGKDNESRKNRPQGYFGSKMNSLGSYFYRLRQMWRIDPRQARSDFAGVTLAGIRRFFHDQSAKRSR